jgi:polyisoprenoid-binding protein YceI
MKKLLSLSAAALLAVACGQGSLDATDAQDAAQGGKTLTVDVAASGIDWYGHKPFVENYGHGGTLAISEGTVGVENGALVSGTFTLDMNSIVCTDEALPQEKKDYLVGHLKSAEFFAVDSFATAVFEITNVTTQEGEYNSLIAGNLTLRGVTNNIQFPANVTVADSVVTLTAPQFNIDRKQWGVMYASTSIVDLAKDNLISDDLGIKINVTAKL